MKKSVRFVALILMFSLLFTLWGCQNSEKPQDTDTTTLPVASPNDGIIDVGQEALPYSEEQLYLQLFDTNNKIEVELDMADAELQKLQEDYEQDCWRMPWQARPYTAATAF